ncbi:aminodeoxychorismate synthase component I [Gaiella sp.]|uniref:aminodeoxychorismate synthase component I n=1 Tax=Gaiella sp. TaxID=2663207 RepID=UPI002E2F56AF|nr:aminodeoxychorismate synthase component I [Gaiella sp.]HEX5582332.1 aminodeoxychorismate synthase component I [Gaiella sp.]
MRTLLIDNYDSFTFNLFQLIAEVNGEEPVVVRNDGATWEEMAGWDVDNIVISPGPGRPERPADFAVCADAIREAEVPLLGVCLGHQGLGHLSGGEVVHAPEVMHGRLSGVHHDGSALFEGIPQGFEVVRYHSLCLAEPLPDSLERTAWTEDGVVMGVAHRDRPSFGVQFHPESICTSHGETLLRNFRDLTLEFARGRRRRGQGGPVRSIVPGRSQAAHGERVTARHLVRRLDREFDSELAFTHLYADDPHAFWLDSSRSGDSMSRFSFMGGSDGPLAAQVYYDVSATETTVVRGGSTEVHAETIFDLLHRELGRYAGVTADLPFDFDCGFVGYIGYEVKADCGGTLVHRSSVPDAAFLFCDRLIAFDHIAGATYLVCLVDDEGEAGERWLDEVERLLDAVAARPTAAAGPVRSPRRQPLDFYLSRDEPTYLADIDRCRQNLVEGETYEVCLTNKVRTDAVLDPLPLYRTLRRINPAPFSAFLRLEGVAVASSSPERFLRVGRDRVVEAKPIKGTINRGETPEEDALLSESLRTSEKNRAENLMITDLLRNDLGTVCEVGSVHVPHLMAIESYETVHQLVSTIRGRLRTGLDAVDCVRACFPGGSMTGAPKKRTMEIIDDLEGEARGVYSGAIGYFGLCGAADLNIVIRTVVMSREETSIGVGGAIVMQSDADEEYQETLLKAEAPMRAIRLSVGVVTDDSADPHPQAGLQDELRRPERARGDDRQGAPSVSVG